MSEQVHEDDLYDQILNPEQPLKGYFDLDSGEIFEDADRALEYKRQKDRMQRQNKNPSFVQLRKGVSPPIIAKIAKRSSVAIEVLMFFFENMDYNNVFVVSQTVIADSVEASTKQVGRAIKILEEEGTIGIGKSGNTNIYMVNPELVWQQVFKKRKNAIMNGTIIFGKEEMEDIQKRFYNVFDNSKDSKLQAKKTLRTAVSTGSVKTKKKPEDNSDEEFSYSPEISYEEEPPEDDDLEFELEED